MTNPFVHEPFLWGQVVYVSLTWHFVRGLIFVIVDELVFVVWVWHITAECSQLSWLEQVFVAEVSHGSRVLLHVIGKHYNYYIAY